MPQFLLFLTWIFPPPFLWGLVLLVFSRALLRSSVSLLFRRFPFMRASSHSAGPVDCSGVFQAPLAIRPLLA